MKFSYDGTGRTIVMADGDELLVHDGETEAPLWRKSLASPLAAVHSSANSVVSLTTGGELCLWDPRSGEAKEEVTLSAANGLDMNQAGLLAIAAETEVLILAGSSLLHTIEAPAEHVSWSRDGLLAVAHGKGLTIYNADYQAGPRATFEEAVGSVRWSGSGFWLVALQSKLVSVTPSGEVSHVTTAPADMQITSLAVTPEGDRIAIQLDKDLVIAMSYPARDSIGQIRYIDRTVTGLAFGPSDWLGVGLDKGDGNKIDLATGATHRTDTHPGREHNSWLLSVAANAKSRKPSAQATEPSGLIPLLLLMAGIAALLYFLGVF